MRAIFLLAVFLTASMPAAPLPLRTAAPPIAIRTEDCAGARASANVIAGALGFAYAHMACLDRGANATLHGSATPQTPAIAQLIAYNVAETDTKGAPMGVGPTFAVPSDVPWVSANGTVVAYIKLDALLLTLRADNPVETAFALENAGVSRTDMLSSPDANDRIYVRVRPITYAQVEKIATVAREHLNQSNSLLYTMTGFVRDCAAPMASLSGVAVRVAREHADVMARTAKTSLGNPLGVVDNGGQVTDATCGFASSTSMRELAAAAAKSSTLANGLFATFVRSIDVAWKLNLPPNPPAESRYNAPHFLPRSEENPPFIADGRRSDGGAIVPYGVSPDRVQIVIPEWTDNLVRESRYKDDLTYIGLGLSGLHPAVVFNAADWAELQRQVVQFRRYLSTLRQPSGKGVDLIFRYSRRDCGPVFDAAISQATGIAMRQSGDPPIRYLQNHWISTIGVSARTRCTYEAMKDEEWSESDSAQPAAGTSEVVLGY